MSSETTAGETPGWPLPPDSAFRTQTAELAMLGPGVHLSLVLMAGHPEIAEAVTHHSKALQSSSGRVRRLAGTLGHAIRIVHGRPEDATQSKKHIDYEHEDINSEVSGSDRAYDATYSKPQKWVLSSLYKAGSFVIPRYTGDQKDWEVNIAGPFYDGHVQFARFFNPLINMPPDREAADEYYREITTSEDFGSTDSSKEVLDMVLGRLPESGQTIKIAGNLVRLILEEKDPDTYEKLNLQLNRNERDGAKVLDRLGRSVYPHVRPGIRRSGPQIHLTYFTMKQAVERIGSIWAPDNISKTTQADPQP